MRVRSFAAAVVAMSLALAACSDPVASPPNASRALGADVLAIGTSGQVFGPERFVRSTGAPAAVTRTLAPGALANVDGPFTLHLVNGPPGTSRSSNTMVSIDGVPVVKTSDLSQNVAALQRVVALRPGSEITVELRGAPGSAIELSIDGVPKPETPPTLLTPTQTTLITQNDVATGCPASPVNGYGFRIGFSWTPATAAKQIVSYELTAGNPGAGLTLLPAEIVATTSYLFTRCGFIPSSSLDAWQWRVRARYADGGVGPWSDTGTFGFLPMPVPVEVLTFSLTASSTRVSLSGAVDANTSSVVLLTAVIDVAVTSLGAPSAVVEFFWDNGTTRQKIGQSASPTLTQSQTNRWWTYTFFWDPAPPTPVGALSIVAVRTDIFGTAFESAAQVVTVVP